jgi:hypothetical protein
MTNEKYKKPAKCPMPDEEWSDGISYCWAVALAIDDNILFDDSDCPCEMFKERV